MTCQLFLTLAEEVAAEAGIMDDGAAIPDIVQEIEVAPPVVPALVAADDAAVLDLPREVVAEVDAIDVVAPVVPDIVQEAIDVIPPVVAAPAAAVDLGVPRLAAGALPGGAVPRRPRVLRHLARIPAFVIRLCHGHFVI